MESISQTKSSKDNFYLKILIVFFTILLCVIITIFATIHTKSSVDRIIHMNFDFRCKEIQSLVSERLEDHERILLSGIGLFNSSENVSRSEWHAFSKNQNLDKKLPGILGFGFSLVIPPKNLNMHIQQVRNEGFPKYNVKPSGNRKMYTSIVYLEPFKGRNLRAFGYDMFSEKVRRTAMEQAVDTGSAALSGKVTLLQETNKGVQAGTLIYLPLYRKGMPINTIKERREAIYGWVYSPYRMNDLIEGIIGTKLIDQNPVIELKIFDSKNILEKNILFQYPQMSSVSSNSDARLTKHIIINFNGHHWTLVFTQNVSSLFSKVYIFPWIILIGGTLITFMFLMLILSLLNTRATNEELTETYGELKESEDSLQAALDKQNFLLKEVMHRTKNNMQVIQSMLRIEGRIVNENNYHDVLKNIENRITALSLVYDMLHTTDSYSEINFKKYIHSLVELLIDNTIKMPVKIEYELTAMIVNIETVMPCGLVINEILTNIIKHAFPGKRADSKNNVIKISLKKVKENAVLEISDNGVGLPDGFDLSKSSSMGMNLVKNLIERQIGGSIEIDGRDGVSYKMIFPVERNKYNGQNIT